MRRGGYTLHIRVGPFSNVEKNFDLANMAQPSENKRSFL